MTVDPDFDLALASFNRTFAAGEAAALGEYIAEDAAALMHEQPALVGRAAIEEAFRELFAAVDTSAFEVDYRVVDVHGDRAYVLASFTETLQPKEAGSAISVDGRLVYFWRREADGWRLTHLLTGRAAPDRAG